MSVTCKNNSQIVPGKQHSLWIDTTPDTGYPPLQDDIEVDIAVVGGGIAGITAAALLKEAGKKVALVDMQKIIKLVTGHTTAKITALQGLIYQRLLKNFGVHGARLYAEANQSAIEQVAAFVQDKKIDCDFKRTVAYTYTELNQNVSPIKEEVRAAQELNLPVAYVETVPLSFDIKGAIMMENQAQFHPRKYLLALTGDIPGDGSYIFENTRALSIKQGKVHTVITDRGELRAKDIIIATQFPFYDTGLFFSRLYPYYAYALGVHTKGQVPEGLYFSEDEIGHSIRNQITESGPVLIIGGSSHKTGQGGDYLENYRNVERYARSRFDIESVDYFWSTMDYDTPDGIPYIGRSPRTERIYIATGFGGWGMTNGTLSGMILSDTILGRDNPWSSLFNPSRTSLTASASTFMTESLNVMRQYTSGYLSGHMTQGSTGIDKGVGKKIIVNTKELAVYRDEEGKLHAISPICSHLACKVNWNNAERTWDCPCHGSRYSYDGEVIHGPALRDLKKETLEE